MLETESVSPTDALVCFYHCVGIFPFLLTLPDLSKKTFYYLHWANNAHLSPPPVSSGIPLPGVWAGPVVSFARMKNSEGDRMSLP